MKSYVMVFDHPFFATTAQDGRFEIKGVPAGTQNLVLWQEKVGYATPGAGRGMPIEVKAGEVKDVGDIVLDAKEGAGLGSLRRPSKSGSRVKDRVIQPGSGDFA